MGLIAYFQDKDLNADQQRLAQELERFISSGQQRVFLLRGYAGTGKTYMLAALIDYFEKTGRSCVLMAPTGKAAKVLARTSGRETYTIHKSIYSNTRIEEYRTEGIDGSETYKFYFGLRNNEDPSDTVYIVDEASMVSDVGSEGEFFRFGSGRLLTDLIDYINFDGNDHDKRLLFVGDRPQLPPIGMDFSPALDPEYLAREFGLASTAYELTEVVRQKEGSAILTNATRLRRSLEEGVFDQLEIQNGPDLVHVKPEGVVAHYLDARGERGEQSILIAQTNRQAHDYNRQIRRSIFPGKDDLQPGDRLIVVANNYAHGRFISNGEFGTVLSVDPARQSVKVPIRKKNEVTGIIERHEVLLRFRNVVIRFQDLDGTEYYNAPTCQDNFSRKYLSNTSSRFG